MNLTWKDGITTILAALVAGMYYAKINNILIIPFINNSYRWSVLALAIIGIVMCAFSGGGPDSGSNTLIAITSILGITALLVIAYGLITGAKIAFVLLTGLIILMWIIATFRHIVAG